MTCIHCVRAVHTALAAVEGITVAEVGIGGAMIEHDGRATIQEVAAAVAIAGYGVRGGTEERRVLPVINAESENPDWKS